MRRKTTRGKMLACVLCCVGLLSFSGCGENTDTFDQASQDLEQGNYTYALSGFQQCIDEGLFPARSYRGAGLSCLRQADYEEAIDYFTGALGCEKVEEKLRKDILLYRATAYMKSGNYSDAMADCQTLAQDFEKDADICFLTGSIALAMDGYEEAAREFDQAFAESSDYDTAIRIYQQYIQREMEADGTRYLEESLEVTPKTAEDYCERGRIYYFMEDYNKAASELIEALNQDSTEARLLLGMVYLAQHDVGNARAMYQDFLAQDGSPGRGYNGLALCDLEENNYPDALSNIAKGIQDATTEEMQSLLYNEIVVYERMLDFDTAREKAEEYTAMFPEDTGVKRELAFLESRSGSPQEEETTEDGVQQ